MNKVKRTSSYTSPLRDAQTNATRERILDAGLEVIREIGNQEDITFKAIAEKAGVTEMTVYRHFPTRADLLQSLWTKMNSQIGIEMPDSLEKLLSRNHQVFEGFDRMAPQMLAGIMSKEGRAVRLSQKEKRQSSYLKVAKDINPKLAPKKRKQVAAIIQLLQSTYAWDSLRSNWDMTPKEISETVLLALESIIATAKELK